MQTQKKRGAHEKTDTRYRAYINILNLKLIPAMGCTEPIAVAYAAARGNQGG